MSNLFDIKVTGAELYLIPSEMRVPIKFGGETMSAVICARAKITVTGSAGTAEGWGETPLSVGWGWPSKKVSFGDREKKLIEFCAALTKAWSEFDVSGHPMEIGSEFMKSRLDAVLEEFNAGSGLAEPMPHLAALICNSLFDVAMHDAYGKLHGIPVYDTYNAKYMNCDLAAYLEAAPGADVSFAGKYPCDFYVKDIPTALPVWHLVGGVDPVDESELTGNEPDDGYPVLLRDWITTDGLNCLKIKLRGNDAEWDFQRIVKIGKVAVEMDVDWLTTDFNCMVTDPEYVNVILDRLVIEAPAVYGKMLYVEQPFPYDMEANQIDVHSVSARKPLFMDESAHDWRFVRLGRSLGWTGVALKTCKTQTGALLSMCWAKAHGMTLMVQDLTNPMLAIVPHVLLAAHAGTIMGVECNAMQFYPDASLPEEKVHAKLYKRRNGVVDFSTVSGPGFGYCLDAIERQLPEPLCSYSK